MRRFHQPPTIMPRRLGLRGRLGRWARLPRPPRPRILLRPRPASSSIVSSLSASEEKRAPLGRTATSLLLRSLRPRVAFRSDPDLLASGLIMCALRRVNRGSFYPSPGTTITPLPWLNNAATSARRARASSAACDHALAQPSCWRHWQRVLTPLPGRVVGVALICPKSAAVSRRYSADLSAPTMSMRSIEGLVMRQTMTANTSDSVQEMMTPAGATSTAKYMEGMLRT